MTEAHVAVRFERVRRSYDGVALVVKNLSLDIHRGEFLTMLGPSGSGRSTCLIMLNGFEAVTRGPGPSWQQAHQQGAATPAEHRYAVSELSAFAPHSCCGEPGYAPKVRELFCSDITNRVSRAHSMVQLRYFANLRPDMLSRGQQQRVALTWASAFNPEILLLVEPLVGPEKQRRDQMRGQHKFIVKIPNAACPMTLREGKCVRIRCRPENCRPPGGWPL